MNWFEKFVAKRLFAWVAKKLDGYKTLIGGVGFILTGGGLIASGLSQGSDVQFYAGLALIGKGMETIGLAGKQEKQIAAIKELTDEQKRKLLA